LFGFDGAKLRRFSMLTKQFLELCAQTVLSLMCVKESAFILIFHKNRTERGCQTWKNAEKAGRFLAKLAKMITFVAVNK